MKTEYRYLLLLCGFIAILAFIALLLFPLVASVRISQTDLRILEARARIVPDAIIPYNESGGHLRILSKDEFFTALAYVRAAALDHGLDVVAFVASEAGNFSVDVTETTVRVTLTGSLDKAVDFVSYMAGDVYNVRHFSLVNAETASFDIWLSIFHEN